MGTPVTEETIKSWYDPKKKGIIVVGMMRSGTQYLSTVIHDTLAKQDPKIDFYGEIPMMHYEKIHNAPLSLVPKLVAEFTWCDNFSVSSIVLPQIMPWMFNYWPIYEIIERDYIVVKLKRTDVLAHLMSTVIFHETHTHSGIKPDQLRDIMPYPISLPTPTITRYMLERQYVHSLPADVTVNYEDLNFGGVTKHMTKNNYGVTPQEFFDNHEYITQYFSSTINHGK